MKCKDCKKKLELYFDNELSDLERKEIESHLLECPDCAKELENLISLNSIGKVATFAEPGSEYWKQLTQAIMQRVPKPRKKEHLPENLMDKLQSLIFKGKISYRLAGLVATAVIIFFIIRISSYHQGKFIPPVEIGVEDSTKSLEKKALAKKSEMKITEEENILNDESARHLSNISSQARDNKLGQKSIVMNEPKQGTMKLDEPEIKPEKISDKRINDIEATQGKAISMSKPAIPLTDVAKSREKKINRISAQPTAANRKEEKLELNQSLAEYPRYQEGAGKIQVIDSSHIQFREAIMKALEESQFHEKLEIWESYIKTEPDLRYIKRAKYQQALLYYNLAKESKKKEDIQQALNYYFLNNDLLFSGTKPDSVRKQVDDLETLLKILEKSEK